MVHNYSRNTKSQLNNSVNHYCRVNTSELHKQIHSNTYLYRVKLY